MPRPRLSDGTRRRLLDASVTNFLERGFHGTGIQQVLDEVGVPKGSFYNYFASKEDWGVAVIGHYADTCSRQLVEAQDGAKTPVESLRRFFELQMRDFERTDFVGGCLLANLAGELDGSEATRRALRDAFDGWRDGIRDLIAAGQTQGLVRDDMTALELAEMLLESWEGAVIRMKIDKSLAPVRRTLDRLLDGYFRP
ncbi:TetR/AcrR family transcriptional regulator [Nocardioides marmorisolisilvae]|uniref:TetR family transcriptional regulator n=1 Tax=Nocardioides marmorisolisilvae TaxID=1542737 RepID=A0A3N0DRV8_9ACTN|nr:TetR/AcrR family transcriptional regulator [Nocardioides marmorisolisilvae]RNL78362.1 TetR family transcriptional regulator [Nocardioides marmorisolisilvae]